MDRYLLYTLCTSIYHVQFEMDREEQGGRNCDSKIQPMKPRMNSNQSHSVGSRELVCGLRRLCGHILYSLPLSEWRDVLA